MFRNCVSSVAAGTGLLLGLAGCGAGAGDVAGVVKYRGQPLAGGTITFYDAANKAMSSGIDEEGKMVGLPTAWLDQINESKQFDAVLVEADNAASRLFKVPVENEPVVPASCQRVVWIMAIKALGNPLDDRSVDGAERAQESLGAGLGARSEERRVGKECRL